MKILYIEDSTTLNPSDVPQDMKDFLTQNPSPSGGRVLRVKVAATHSGRPTKNNMLYLPQNMSNSIDTWITPFAKPILVHHDSYSDPIGRVVSARYIDTSHLLRDRFSDFSAINDAKQESISPVLFDAFVAGKLSIRETVNICNNKIMQDAFEDENFPGLGYIELTIDIANPEAAQKILDGRYLTGSTSASTTRAICSICKTDWIAEDQCDHEPGKVYDGVKCILIAGDFNYSEYSFVNKPADALSQVLSFGDDTGGKLQDCTTYGCTFSSSFNKSMLIYDSFQSVKQPNLSEDIKMQKLTLDEATELLFKDGLNRDELATQAEAVLKHIEDNNLFACDPCEAKDVFLTVYAELYPVKDEVAKTETAEGTAEEKTEETADTTETEDTATEETDKVRAFLADEYDAIVGEDEWGVQYAEMITDALQSEDAVLVQEMKDAKLTANARKSLSKSTFCKPPSGYPVPDCAHAKAAMAYAKKNSEASSVVSCIRRKAARLGCPFKDEELTVGRFVPDYFDRYEDTEMQQLHMGLTIALKERNILTVSDTKELETEIQTLKDENKKLQEEIQQTEDALVVRTNEVKDLTVERIIDLSCLAEEEHKDISTMALSFSDKSLEECNILLEDYVKKVDRAKIQEKLITGLGNVPVAGIVKNPLQDETNIDTGKKVEVKDTQTQQTEETKTVSAGNVKDKSNTEKQSKQLILTDEQKQQVLNQYFQYRLNGPGGQKVADEYLASLSNQGYNIKDILGNR